MNDGLILGVGLIAFVCLMMVSVVLSDFAVGCYMLGQEINGDNSVEYLMLGNCQ